MHLEEQQISIVKIMPNAVNQVAISRFAKIFNLKATLMGLDNNYLDYMYSTQYQGRDSSKETNSALKFVPFLERASWPTLMLESRVSMTITCLRADVHWGLTSFLASRAVNLNIVLIFSMTKYN